MSDNPARVSINLPTENLVDIFACLPRRTLAVGVALTSRRFAAIANYWLHDKPDNKITLQYFCLAPFWDVGKMRISNNWGEEVPFPLVDLPANIVDFHLFHIGFYFGGIQRISNAMQSVLAMLTRMRPILQKANICLTDFKDLEGEWESEDDDEEVHAIAKMFSSSGQAKSVSLLKILVPVLQGCLLNSIRCTPSDGLFNAPNYYSPLFTSLRILDLKGDQDLSDEIMDFLTFWTSSADYSSLEGAADSRFLIVTLTDVDASEMIWRLRQKFFTASRPVSFFVRMQISNRTLQPLPEFSLRNEERGEKFELEQLGRNKFLLSRCSADKAAVEGGWPEKRKAEVLGWNFEAQNRRILVEIV